MTKLQARVGIIFLIANALGVAVNALWQPPGYLYNVGGLAVSAGIAALTIRPSLAGKITQVSLLGVWGILAVLTSPPMDVVGPVLLVLGIMLAARYGWLKPKLRQIVEIAAVIVVGARAAIGGYNIFGAIFIVVAVVATLVVLEDEA